MAIMRLASGSFLALFSLGVVSTTVACTDDAGDKPDTGKVEPPTKVEEDKTPVVAESTGKPAGEAGPGAAEATGTTTSGGEIAPPEPVIDIPALLEQAKDLKTPDKDALAALDAAKAAGADKIEAAKVANTRGEKLIEKGEIDRATPFFEWAKDTHTLYGEPVFNLAKQACLAGDADLCKELLLEVQKRGNKKLVKQVGIDPIFTPVQDDPEVRKLYEK